LEDWKVRVSVLWLFYAVAFLVVMILASFEPGVLKQFLDTGEMEGMKIGPEILLLFAVLLLVPLVMAFVSVTLRDSVNRWANIVVGIVFAGFQLVALIGTLAQPSAWAILMESSKVVAPALIVWYAWKSKQKA